MVATYAGIDYGHGLSNRDALTGVRYGVIPENIVGQEWYENSTPDYGEPTCGKCGNEAKLTADYLAENYAGQPNPRWADDKEYLCTSCEYTFHSEEAYPNQSLGSFYQDEEYKASCGDDGDIFIFSSPYYTRSQYCSPCAPGAGYLTAGFSASPGTDGATFNSLADAAKFPKVYCFGHDWFEDKKAPYRVFRVDDNSEVFPEQG